MATLNSIPSRGRSLSQHLSLGGTSGSRFLTNRLARWLFLACALLVLSVMVFMLALMLWEAAPAIREVGLGSMLFGRTWAPDSGQFGFLPLIAGTLFSTLVALIIALPLSLGSAIFMAEIAPPRIGRIARTSVELLAGIPSVVYGLVGILVVCPILADVGGVSGRSVAAAGIVLGVMILPTVTMISEDAIRAVPHHYREAALALGATRWQTTRRVLLPAARSGIVAAIVLGIGRAIGETMAMTMVIGNQPLVPRSIFDPAYTLTGAIANEALEAGQPATSVLFFAGVVLLCLVMAASLVAIASYRKTAR